MPRIKTLNRYASPISALLAAHCNLNCRYHLFGQSVFPVHSKQYRINNLAVYDAAFNSVRLPTQVTYAGLNGHQARVAANLELAREKIVHFDTLFWEPLDRTKDHGIFVERLFYAMEDMCEHTRRSDVWLVDAQCLIVRSRPAKPSC